MAPRIGNKKIEKNPNRTAAIGSVKNAKSMVEANAVKKPQRANKALYKR